MAAGNSGLTARAATWEKECNAGNLTGVVALYTGDGCRMSSNQPAAHGHDAILAEPKASKDRGVAKVKVAVTSDQTRSGRRHGNVRDQRRRCNTSRSRQMDVVLEEIEGRLQDGVRHLQFGYADALNEHEIAALSARVPTQAKFGLSGPPARLPQTHFPAAAGLVTSITAGVPRFAGSITLQTRTRRGAGVPKICPILANRGPCSKPRAGIRTLGTPIDHPG